MSCVAQHSTCSFAPNTVRPSSGSPRNQAASPQTRGASNSSGSDLGPRSSANVRVNIPPPRTVARAMPPTPLRTITTQSTSQFVRLPRDTHQRPQEIAQELERMAQQLRQSGSEDLPMGHSSTSEDEAIRGMRYGTIPDGGAGQRRPQNQGMPRSESEMSLDAPRQLVIRPGRQSGGDSSAGSRNVSSESEGSSSDSRSFQPPIFQAPNTRSAAPLFPRSNPNIQQPRPQYGGVPIQSPVQRSETAGTQHSSTTTSSTATVTPQNRGGSHQRRRSRNRKGGRGGQRQ